MRTYLIISFLLISISFIYCNENLTFENILGEWKLENVIINDTINRSGYLMKDKYILEFKNDSSYSKTEINNKFKYSGIWKIIQDQKLTITNHKKSEIMNFLISAGIIQ